MAETAVIKRKPKYKTRWCAQGWCEGERPRTFLGNPAPTCKSTSEQCSCGCHKKIDEMYELAGEPRELHDMSDYSPGAGRLEMPDRLALAEARAAALAATKSPDAPGAVVAAGHVFVPTETGIRSPGQLEYAVLDELHEWLDPSFELLHCTPKALAELMGHKNPPEPSKGAIHAIFVRWMVMGFCKFQNRPARFLGFTGDSSVEHLDKLKLQSKQGRK